MTDLLPCPFCNETHVLLYVDMWDNAQVECESCGAMGPSFSLDNSGRDEQKALQKAAAAWNRASPAVTEPIVFASSFRIGNTSGYHTVVDGAGVRIYIGNDMIWPIVSAISGGSNPTSSGTVMPTENIPLHPIDNL